MSDSIDLGIVKLPDPPAVRQKLELLPVDKAPIGWKRPGSWSSCEHRGQKIIEERQRRVVCSACGDQVDTFTALLEFVDYWRRNMWALEEIAAHNKREGAKDEERDERREREHKWLRHEGAEDFKHGRVHCRYKSAWRQRLWQQGFNEAKAANY